MIAHARHGSGASLPWTGNDVSAGRDTGSPQTFSSHELPVFLHMGEKMDFLGQ